MSSFSNQSFEVSSFSNQSFDIEGDTPPDTPTAAAKAKYLATQLLMVK